MKQHFFKTITTGTVAVSALVLGMSLESSAKNQKENGLTREQRTLRDNKDIEIAQRIRQDIMKEKDFSTDAQNIKIITVNGKVTLKGDVRTEQELNSILRHARPAAGETNVTNALSIAR